MFCVIDAGASGRMPWWVEPLWRDLEPWWMNPELWQMNPQPWRMNPQPWRMEPPPGELRPGPVHVVQRGQSVWSIARIYGVRPETIIRLNRLRRPDTIYPGQLLRLPLWA